MGVATAWVISPHPSTRQLVGLNLNKRGFRILEAAVPSDLGRPDVEPDLIVVDIDPPPKLLSPTAVVGVGVAPHDVVGDDPHPPFVVEDRAPRLSGVALSVLARFSSGAHSYLDR